MNKNEKIAAGVIGSAAVIGILVAVTHKGASAGGGNGGTGNTGTILTGTVKDPGGNPISGATVSYGGVTETSDVAGNYSFDNVPAGATAVTCSASGYQTMSLTTTVVDGQTNYLDFTMQPGPAFLQSDVIENMNAPENGSWTILFFADQSGNIGNKPYVFYVMVHNAPQFETSNYSIVSIDGNSAWQLVEAATDHKFSVGDIIYQPNSGYPDYGVHVYSVTAYQKESDGVYRYVLTATDAPTIVTHLPVGFVDASWEKYTNQYGTKFNIGDQIYNTSNPAAVFTIVGITVLGGVVYYDFNGNWGEPASIVDSGQPDPTFLGVWMLYTGS